ncbi:HlyD family secretion protein [Acinetobacter lactucae]|uniref:HlyD family secretion protein n=1 Tax=Acinetobacter lactucae TaxID=1785128 RepID=UPI00077E2407|nr:HlyD family efflux transporter periplasmic adaptor subunit [Acinetobacter lactucae]
MNRKLFREKAVDAQKSHWMGEVILISPVSFSILIGFVTIFTLFISLFLFFGSYTKKTSVEGQLMPDSGLIRIYVPDGGVVSQKFVHEGQKVRKLDPLYELKMNKFSQNGNYNDSIEQQIQLKQQALNTEKLKIRDLHTHSLHQTTAEIQSLKLEINKMDLLIQEQRKRLSLAQENMNRYQLLRKKDYISVEEFQAKQDIYLNQQLTLKNYERDQIAKQSELDNKQIVLSSLQSKLENDLNSVDRQIATGEQEMIEMKARGSQVIKASANGVVTSISAEPGQQVSQNVPLLNIIPDHSKLQAHLYVPSSAIGFIHLNQVVKLRLQAFPYQKFGQVTGKIISVSETTMSAQELASSGEFSNNLNTNTSKAVYLVKVKLDQQHITAYGNTKTFRVGMVFDADIMQEKRRLYEWVLEPLYSITGKI